MKMPKAQHPVLTTAAATTKVPVCLQRSAAMAISGSAWSPGHSPPQRAMSSGAVRGVESSGRRQDVRSNLIQQHIRSGRSHSC